MRRIAAIIVAALIAVAGTTVPASADRASLEANATSVAAMLDSHNAIRRQHGLAPLTFLPTVAAQIAQPWTIKMRADGVKHNPSFYWQGATFASENVGWAQAPDPVAYMMETWMNSADHRANILDPNVTHIAIGAVRSGSDLWATADFYAGNLVGAGPGYASGASWLASLDEPAPSGFVRTAPYTLPGDHVVNGRQWRTTCEPYSRTERCRTEIQASVVNRSGNTYSIRRGWAFNNLTYLPYMTRAQWSVNPLGRTGEWTASDGARWRSECDTRATGANACRSYRWTTVYSATARPGGGYTFGQSNTWVFNNIVMFG